MADYRETYDSGSEYSSDNAFSESEDEEIQTLPSSLSQLCGLTKCECENCRAMDNDRESICCNEIDSVKLKIEQFKEEMATNLSCITRHPGFQSVCLDRRQRYVAYRQLARWCWGYLGKEVRVVLPTHVQ
ncbi:uncharacterized protein LOC132754241 [Ruditapes philippinarum]|uniref:uncharacterized protein LOC132754241 n=1 Tax=Ruditapes philippinarum TaxID=129788 RepID=UPI00295B3C3A|nr:uncharacterized protein LOC132754241 [Ruditapes philippinarum]